MIAKRLYCVIVLEAFVTSGCGDYIRHVAVNAVASELPRAEGGVIARLQSAANPTGQGVLVFVRASDCTPQYAWLWLNDGIPAYAVDSASKRLTPRLRALADAPADV